MGPSIPTSTVFAPELKPFVEEPLAQEVIAPWPTIEIPRPMEYVAPKAGVEEPSAQEVVASQSVSDVTSVALEAVEVEPSHPEIMALEQEVTPTIAISKVVTPTVEGVVFGVGLFRGLSEFSTLPRLMEGNFLSSYYELFVRSIIYQI